MTVKQILLKIDKVVASSLDMAGVFRLFECKDELEATGTLSDKIIQELEKEKPYIRDGSVYFCYEALIKMFSGEGK